MSSTLPARRGLNEKICAAIAERRCLRFFYNGGYRAGEPFAHGESRDGDELLLLYQTEGHSASGSPPGWRTFRLDRLWELEVLPHPVAAPRPGFDPSLLPMSRVCCHWVEP